MKDYEIEKLLEVLRQTADCLYKYTHGGNEEANKVIDKAYRTIKDYRKTTTKANG